MGLKSCIYIGSNRVDYLSVYTNMGSGLDNRTTPIFSAQPHTPGEITQMRAWGQLWGSLAFGKNAASESRSFVFPSLLRIILLLTSIRKLSSLRRESKYSTDFRFGYYYSAIDGSGIERRRFADVRALRPIQLHNIM